jgi:hypothetical protein
VKEVGENCIFRPYDWHYQVTRNAIYRECRTKEEERNAYRIIVGKPEGMRPLGRPKRR